MFISLSRKFNYALTQVYLLVHQPRMFLLMYLRYHIQCVCTLCICMYLPSFLYSLLILVYIMYVCLLLLQPLLLLQIAVSVSVMCASGKETHMPSIYIFLHKLYKQCKVIRNASNCQLNYDIVSYAKTYLKLIKSNKTTTS